MYESLVRGGLWASFYLMILEREGGDCFGAIPHPVLGVAYGLLLLPYVLCIIYANRGNGMERYAPELSSVPVWLTLQSCKDGKGEGSKKAWGTWREEELNGPEWTLKDSFFGLSRYVLVLSRYSYLIN